MKYFQQLDRTDCGPACLAMMASYFGVSLSIAQIRTKAGTDLDGTTILGLVSCANDYNLNAIAVKGTEESISTKTPVPFIAHFEVEENGVVYPHFVIVRKIYKKKILIINPDPYEKRKLISREEFFDKWTGNCIFFEPANEVLEKNTIKWSLMDFLPFFKPHKKIFIASFFASILMLIFGLFSSFYLKYLFDEVVFSKSTVNLFSVSIAMLVVVIFQTIVGAIRSIFLQHFSFKIDLQMSFSYLAHIFKLPVSFFETRQNGEIISRLNDLDKIKQTLTNTAVGGILDLIMVLVSGPVLYLISNKLFFISFISILIVGFLAVSLSFVYKKNYATIISNNAEVQSFLYECMNGISTIKALNSEDEMKKGFEDRKMKAVISHWNVQTIHIIQGFINGLVNGITGILIYWLGIIGVMNLSLSLGTVVTFNALLAYFKDPLLRLLNIQSEVQESLVAARRVGEVLELEGESVSGLEIKNMRIPESLPIISFNDICFRYGKKMALFENFSLQIKAGSWNAIVGSSGSGKSTLGKLLLRFYEVESGDISLMGINLYDINVNSIRSFIGYVPQDIFLFSGTIKENISLHNPDATIGEIKEAAKKAGADQFIESLPMKYETQLGEHGGGLSGGEKQRIAIARALLGNPKILVLDEATSNLDNTSEKQIHEVIRKIVLNNVTVILIAHRLSTVVNCDSIFVLEKGRLIEHGTHKELLEKRGKYREMWGEQE